MAAFRDFDRYVMPYVAGAPMPAVDDALLQAAIEFCEKTYAINEDFFVKAPAKPEILVDSADSNLDPYAVLEVYGTECKLAVETKQTLREKYPDGWQDETVDLPDELVGWMSLGENTIRLIPYLTAATTEKVLRLEVAMKPSLDATALPDLLLARWPEKIAAGALARLHAHANVPYADPNRVARYEAIFNSAISKAADEVEAGFNRPQLRTGLDEFP